MGGTIGWGPHNIERKSLAMGGLGGPSQEMIPLCGFILQAETCQILSLAENPRWSKVWQYIILQKGIQKEEVICLINPANSNLFPRLIILDCSAVFKETLWPNESHL